MNMADSSEGNSIKLEQGQHTTYQSHVIQIQKNIKEQQFDKERFNHLNCPCYKNFFRTVKSFTYQIPLLRIVIMLLFNKFLSKIQKTFNLFLYTEPFQRFGFKSSLASR